ncbi:MAG: 16S rRNA (guanine(966)-N(2))-methyltransferase RsmD [Isosphaeraceae bacterium]
MRIIAGQRRGHKINGPKRDLTRPTSDFVRESVFNILRDAVEGRVVVDLFAGTGALGLEALSRGAIRALFIERDRENAALIRTNLATLRYEDRGSVVVADVFRWIKSYAPLDSEPVVVFIDPPYAEYQQKPERMRQLLETLVGKLPRESILLVEAGRIFGAENLPKADAWDVRRYGGTHLALGTVGEGGLGEETPTANDNDNDGGDDAEP